MAYRLITLNTFMVVSGLLIKFPYWVCWKIRQLTGHLHGTVFYVESMHDYQIIENILRHLQIPVCIAARTKSLAARLRQEGISVMVWPVYPKTLIMARHAFHRFPIDGISKIGLMHGPYYFKQMISSKKYNAFDLYLFTSSDVLNKAKSRGITCGAVGGYARIDTLKSDETREKSQQLWDAAGFCKEKTTLLFTATWDRSGQSAVDKWIDKLDHLKKTYNVMVSLHPMMTESIKKTIRSTEGILYVNQQMLYAAMTLADMLVSDTSSVIAEFCALDKPIITFDVSSGRRLTTDIQSMIRDISEQITGIEEIDQAIALYHRDKNHKRGSRQRWINIMYDDIGISHGEKAAKIISAFIDKQNLA